MLEIKTARLCIRHTDHESADVISAMNTTDNVSEHLASLSPAELEIILQNKEKLAQLLDRFTGTLHSDDREFYGAWIGERLIGYISITNASSEIPELQIEIAPDCHRLGYGYEFMQALLQQLFEKMKYEHIRYTVMPSNIASIALVEKIGAIIQKSESKVEELLVKTYYISKISMGIH